MPIIKMIFNEKSDTCLMFKGNIRLEEYTYTEGEIVLGAMQ